MIELTRLNGDSFLLNAELIEQIDTTPDTVITLMTGNNIVVREKMEVVLERIIDYRQKTRESHNRKMDNHLNLLKGAA